MKWRYKDAILWGSVITCVTLATFVAFGVDDWTLHTWGPSLACNFLTTGLAIWVINVVVADFDNRERKRQEEHKQLHETMRQNRVKLRRDRRKALRRQMMRLQVNSPVVSTLHLGEGLMKAAEDGDLQGALAHIKDRQEKYLEHANALGQMITVYNRFMTLKELNHLEGLRRAVKALSMEVDTQDDADKHKVAIVTFLDYLNICSLTLGQAFVDHDLMDAQGRFNEQLGSLERKWNVPATRQSLREEAQRAGTKNTPETRHSC